MIARCPSVRFGNSLVDTGYVLIGRRLKKDQQNTEIDKKHKFLKNISKHFTKLLSNSHKTQKPESSKGPIHVLNHNSNSLDSPHSQIGCNRHSLRCKCSLYSIGGYSNKCYGP